MHVRGVHSAASLGIDIVDRRVSAILRMRASNPFFSFIRRDTSLVGSFKSPKVRAFTGQAADAGRGSVAVDTWPEAFPDTCFKPL